MIPTTPEDKRRLVIAVCLLASIAAAAAVLFWSGYHRTLWEMLRTTFQNKDEMRDYLRSWGPWAPVGFICIQALQVLVAPIPGEVTGAAGGFLFGAFPNILYSSLGLTVGSVIAFLLSRAVGLPFVKLVVRAETIDKFHFLTKPRGEIATLALFIIPGFPKDILSYLLGLSPMRFTTFLWVCGLGRIPGTAMLSFGGAALYKENWVLLTVLSGLCLIAFLVVYLRKDAIRAWLRKGRSSVLDGEAVSGADTGREHLQEDKNSLSRKQ